MKNIFDLIDNWKFDYRTGSWSLDLHVDFN